MFSYMSRGKEVWNCWSFSHISGSRDYTGQWYKLIINTITQIRHKTTKATQDQKCNNFTFVWEICLKVLIISTLNNVNCSFSKYLLVQVVLLQDSVLKPLLFAIVLEGIIYGNEVRIFKRIVLCWWCGFD